MTEEELMSMYAEHCVPIRDWIQQVVQNIVDSGYPMTDEELATFIKVFSTWDEIRQQYAAMILIESLTAIQVGMKQQMLLSDDTMAVFGGQDFSFTPGKVFG